MGRETLDFNQTPSANRLHISFFGRRNAGKSSVVNAVTGQNLAIVSDVKGTTTDPVSKAMELLPLGPVVITDTPGIDDTGQVGEMRVDRTMQVLRKTDLAVLVVDNFVGLGADDVALIEKFREKQIPFIVALNKVDLDMEALIESHEDPDYAFPWIRVSAATGQGIDSLEETISGLFPMPSVPAGEILTNVRQADAVKRALEYMQAALETMSMGMTPDITLTETEGAMAALGELTGRTVREDVTNRIFQRFCVGK